MTVRLKAILLSALFLIPLMPLRAVATDYVLAIDSSESMKRADPKALRIEAAKLFVRLLQRGDRVAVIKTSDRPELLTELQDAEAGRFSILRALGRIGSTGELKDIYTALKLAVSALKESNAERKIILLISDGRMNLGSEDRNEDYTLKLLDELLPECKKKGIAVYTIAFTEHSDLSLLKEIAQLTRGLFYFVDSADRLHLTITDVFSDTKLPDQIPVKDMQFLVDREIKEMKVVLSRKDNKSVITLLQPDGRKVTYRRHPSHYRWNSARAYEIVSVTKPLPGPWRIINAAKDESRVFISSDLSLKITDIPRAAKGGKKQKLYVWLQDGERILKSTPLVLRAVEFNVFLQSPDDKLYRVALNDDGADDDDLAKDGVYTGSTTPEKDGQYLVRFVATGKGFSREKSIRFYVRAVKKPEIEKKTAPVSENKSKRDKNLKKKTVSEDKKDYSLRHALFKFAIFNVVLIAVAGLGFGVVYFTRKRKASPEQEEAEE